MKKSLAAQLFQLVVIFFFSRVTDVGMNSILTGNKTISQKIVTEFSKFWDVQKLLFSHSLVLLDKTVILSNKILNAKRLQQKR